MSLCSKAVLPLSLRQDKSENTPLVMGILNVTPDSACETGRFQQISLALEHAHQLIAEGADIIDIGGEPTNPGVNPRTPLSEELSRVIPLVKQLRQETDIPISVDTSKPEVMQQAIDAGASMINDVRALTAPGALSVVANSGLPVCIMHMRFPNGLPAELPKESNDVLVEIKNYLRERRDACVEAGIRLENIILDPGIGHGNFGKNTRQNLLILKHLSDFLQLECPLLICVSRKTFIGEVLDLPIPQRGNASIAGAVMAAINGASIIRVHDVKATVEAIKLTTAMMEVI